MTQRYLKRITISFHPSLPGRIANLGLVLGLIVITGLICNTSARTPLHSNPEYIEDATFRLQEALRNNDTTNLASGLLELAGYYREQGNIGQAVEYYTDAAGFFEAIGNINGKTSAYIGLGFAYTQASEYRKALRTFEVAMELAQTVRDSCLMVHVLLGEADIYQQMDKTDKAIPLLTNARDIARNNHYRDLLVQALNGLSTIENKKGDYLSSLVHYKESKSITDSITATPITDAATQKADVHGSPDESKLMTLEKEYQAQKYKMARHRLWLYGLAGTILLLVMAGILFFYIIRIRNRRSTAKLTLQNLRQQMNPHFLFNVMNSVYLHMLEGDKSASMEYLSKLTKILRKTLENSRQDMVHLGEEIELLELYLELEQKRLQKITWEILVDSAIDPENLMVPSMLIQPYVENSVIHGLSNLEGEGKIEVHFKMNGGTVHCEITDNGIGRNSAGKLNGKKRKGHHSLGTSITMARLELLNNLYKKPVKAVYSDILDTEHRVAGTKVLLDIPFEINSPQLA